MNTVTIDSILKQVEKPARYSGGELNACIKDKASVAVHFAMAFPDTYEVGMSHLGSKIIYALANEREDTYCERVFAPWVDMEALMRAQGVPLFSIESRTPIKQFDLVGFTLQYEMSYTNILNMLDLAGIPQFAADRAEDCPIICAGGPCACNPEPIADFFDFFIIGDGEETIGDMLDCYAKWKQSGQPKEVFLQAIAQIEGFYVPKYYTPTYNEDGTFAHMVIADGAPAVIKRRIVQDLDAAFFPTKPIVPYISIVHDRITLELFRGCTRGCRFCQAGFIYRPIRERKRETVRAQACASIANTGYDEMSLSSLSSGDYTQLGGLIDDMVEDFADKRVSFSLPSLRIDSFSPEYAKKMQQVRKSTLTFAPEAGTQRLRDVINKGVSEADLIRSVSDAFASGWNSVKLYFMIGLPTETTEDLDGIVDLAKKVGNAYYAVPKDQRQKGLRIGVSVSSFVPKPCTPFGWEPQNTIEELQQKQQYLKDRFKGVRGVEYNYHSPRLSSLEAVFARGDRKLSQLLMAAWKNGSRFDSWNDCFSYDRWALAFEQTGLDKAFYAYRKRADDEVFPYAHIDMHVKQSYLRKERDCALGQSVTGDCRAHCNGCFSSESLQRFCKDAPQTDAAQQEGGAV